MPFNYWSIPKSAKPSFTVSVEPITLRLEKGEIPDDITALLAEGSQRCDGFFEAGLGRRYPRYLPSNPAIIYAAIVSLKKSGYLRGDVFCE